MATVLCVVVSLCNQLHHLDMVHHLDMFQEYDRCNCPTLATTPRTASCTTALNLTLGLRVAPL